jgi:MOSC domain-containing protein YiiM
VLGENITTRGVDLLALSTGTRLQLGTDALIEVTGLRNPCVQLDTYERGLQRAVLDRDDAGNLIRRAGVMAIVLKDGVVRAGDAISISSPAVHRSLEPV